MENGYTKEEMKMTHETKKIMRDESILVTATTVRVPVMGGHSEAVNVEFENEFELADIRNILENAPGVVVVDDPTNFKYPMPILSIKKLKKLKANALQSPSIFYIHQLLAIHFLLKSWPPFYHSPFQTLFQFQYLTISPPFFLVPHLVYLSTLLVHNFPYVFVSK